MDSKQSEYQNIPGLFGKEIPLTLGDVNIFLKQQPVIIHEMTGKEYYMNMIVLMTRLSMTMATVTKLKKILPREPEDNEPIPIPFSAGLAKRGANMIKNKMRQDEKINQERVESRLRDSYLLQEKEIRELREKNKLLESKLLLEEDKSIISPSSSYVSLNLGPNTLVDSSTQTDKFKQRNSSVPLPSSAPSNEHSFKQKKKQLMKIKLDIEKEQVEKRVKKILDEIQNDNQTSLSSESDIRVLLEVIKPTKPQEVKNELADFKVMNEEIKQLESKGPDYKKLGEALAKYGLRMDITNVWTLCCHLALRLMQFEVQIKNLGKLLSNYCAESRILNAVCGKYKQKLPILPLITMCLRRMSEISEALYLSKDGPRLLANVQI